ncbi:MAG: glutamate 5-kinase [Endomicrobiia bacterium]
MEIKRIVVKIGSNLVSKDRGKYLTSLVEQISLLKKDGCEIILVSSGAIVTGVIEYNLWTKPRTIVEKQAYASIGQPLLMKNYIDEFKLYKIKVAQILLTREDFDSRERYLNIRNTLNHLLKMGVIPIINENDAVANEEIKLGDNDTLSAVVASKLSADMLIILTDVEGLYNKNPKKHSDAVIVPEIKNVSTLKKICSKNGFSHTDFFCSTGGMKTKIEASKIACLSGVETIIASGLKKNVLLDIYSGEKTVGTRFCPLDREISSRKRWIAFGKKIKGRIIIDDGAADAIINKNKSLLSSGIKFIEGKFYSGEVISIVDEKNNELARGITNFGVDMLEMIKGKKTSEIKKQFPELTTEEVIHRDNLVIL